MKLQELKKMQKNAPQAGQLLAYTRERVIFQPYRTMADLENICGEEKLLEIHLFTREKEYRAVSSSRKQKETVIEYTADFPEEKDELSGQLSTYKETVILETELDSEIKSITIINHISYDENGMASIDDYRMVLGGND